MSQPDTIKLEMPEGAHGEVVPFPAHFELANEENINRLGHCIRMRVPDTGTPLEDPEKEEIRQRGLYMPMDWKPLGFIHNASGILIKVAQFLEGQRSEDIKCSEQTKYYRPNTLFPVNTLSGLREVNLGEGQIGIAFKYYKQLQGEEPAERIIIPYGFAYGVHTGHLGVPEKDIPAEPNGWYIVGEQVRNQDGHIVSDGERNFPLSRIIDGPIGDPRDPKHREVYGIY